MFSPFDFDVCTSPDEQEAAAGRARPLAKGAGAPPLPAPPIEENDRALRTGVPD